eukprot:4343289-Pleurochrysis_carterae.AAC.3
MWNGSDSTFETASTVNMGQAHARACACVRAPARLRACAPVRLRACLAARLRAGACAPALARA